MTQPTRLPRQHDTPRSTGSRHRPTRARATGGTMNRAQAADIGLAEQRELRTRVGELRGPDGLERPPRHRRT